MTDDEKVEALCSIANGVLEKYPFRKAFLHHRFDRWGITTSQMFIEIMEAQGYELVRKVDIDG